MHRSVPTEAGSAAVVLAYGTLRGGGGWRWGGGGRGEGGGVEVEVEVEVEVVLVLGHTRSFAFRHPFVQTLPELVTPLKGHSIPMDFGSLSLSLSLRR